MNILLTVKNSEEKILKSINPHNLDKTIEISGEVAELFKYFRKETEGKNLGNFDFFTLGYFMGTNPILRKKYDVLKKEVKRNNKIIDAPLCKHQFR